MKQTIIMLLITLSCKGQFEKRDYYHMYAGTGVTVIGTELSYLRIKNPTKACLIGFGSGVLAGVGKEVVYDKWMGRGVFSYMDMVNTAWGSFVTGFAMRCILDYRETKKNKYEYKFKVYE